MNPGAYGLQIVGAGRTDDLLLQVPEGWPRLEIVRREGPSELKPTQIRDEDADVSLLGEGSLTIERRPLKAVFTTLTRLTDDELVHPYLAPAATVASRWLGRESFHAGGFVVDGAVWGLLGDQESGKSSTLAWLGLNDHEVFCDDVLILDGLEAYAGPRSVDLREETARRLGIGDSLGVVGERERWRVRLGTQRSSAPIKGWVFLEWSERLELVRIPAAQAISRLFEQRAVRLPPTDPAGILELLTLPAWSLSRPRRWQCLEDASRRLLEVAA
jgi:hypothetical protein